MSVNMNDPAQLNGTTVVGGDGQKLGDVDAVYYDNATDRAEWVAVRSGLFGTRVTLVPLRRADYTGDELRVPFDKVQLRNAPHHDPGNELSSTDEADLYRYYGIGPTADASASRRRPSPSSGPSRATSATSASSTTAPSWTPRSTTCGTTASETVAGNPTPATRGRSHLVPPGGTGLTHGSVRVRRGARTHLRGLAHGFCPVCEAPFLCAGARRRATARATPGSARPAPRSRRPAPTCRARASVSAGPSCLAITLPSSTPHWSNESMPQIVPSTNVTCS